MHNNHCHDIRLTRRRQQTGRSLISRDFTRYGQPVAIENVLAKRSLLGLMRQHLTALLAAAEIGKAVVAGEAIGSSKVMFHLHELSAGEYKYNWSEESGTVEEVTNAREPCNAITVEIESQHVT